MALSSDFYTSPSSRELVKSCIRKFNFQGQAKQLGIPREPGGIAALTGNIFHSMIECRFLNIDSEEFVRSSYPDYPEDSDTQHNWKYVLLTWKVYQKRYPIEDEPSIFEVQSEGLEYPGVELHWKDEEVVDNAVYKDQGFIDRIIWDDDGIGVWAVDTKSTKRNIEGRDWKIEHASKLQFAIYIRWLRNNLTVPVYGVMVDSIQHSRGQRRFNRMWFKDEYTEEKCNDIIAFSDELVQYAVEEPDIPNKDNCFAYGQKCQFYDICHNDKYLELDFWDRLPQWWEDQSNNED